MKLDIINVIVMCDDPLYSDFSLCSRRRHCSMDSEELVLFALCEGWLAFGRDGCVSCFFVNASCFIRMLSTMMEARFIFFGGCTVENSRQTSDERVGSMSSTFGYCTSSNDSCPSASMSASVSPDSTLE